MSGTGFVQSVPLPLHSSRLAHDHDIDRLRAALVEATGPLRVFDPVGEEAFITRSGTVELGDMTISVGAHSPVIGRSPESHTMTMFLPLGGYAVFQDEAGTFPSVPGHTAVLQSGAEFMGQTEAYAGAAFGVDRERLRRTIAVLNGPDARDKDAIRAGEHTIGFQASRYLDALRHVVAMGGVLGNDLALIGSLTLDDQIYRIIAAMISDLAGATARPVSDRDGQAAVARACELMRARLAEPLTMTEIEREAGVSRRVLAYHFNRKLGVTPKQWLREQRLQRAYDLLAGAAAVSVTRAAMLAGFPHLSDFGQRFRARFGILPSDVIRRSGSERPEEQGDV